MSADFVKVTCSHVLPTRPITHDDFLTFCQIGLGVVPLRVVRDLEAWLEEDIGHGDEAVVAGLGANPEACAVVVAKERFVLSGLHLMAEIIRLTCGAGVRIVADFSEGDVISKGEVVLAAFGRAAGLLLAERTALNIGSRLSGVASKTREAADALNALRPVGQKPALLETRKTTPGLRLYEKYATRLGGARNHRHGLDAGAMLKENHLRAIGRISSAVESLQASIPVLSKVEVEVTSLAELRIALASGADVVMLDNFSEDDVRVAVGERNEKYPSVKLELSGNLDAGKVDFIVRSGVDFASMGALIHKAMWVDMSMQLYL